MNSKESPFRLTMKRIAFGSPSLIRNLIFFPLYDGDDGDGGRGDRPSVISLHRAVKDEMAEIRDSGQVNWLDLINKSDRKIVGIDGQEVLGGFQNRILTVSTLIDASSRNQLPALCVEQGRWQGSSPHFRDGSVAYPTIRNILARTVPNERHTVQAQVWSSISESLERTKRFSATQSMSDLYQSFEDDLDRLADNLPCDENQTGTAVLVRGSLLSVDSFSSPELFQSYYPLLARSHILESMMYEGKPMQWKELDTLRERILSRLDRAGESEVSSADADRHRIVEGSGIYGTALIHQDRTIHLSAFAEV